MKTFLLFLLMIIVSPSHAAGSKQCSEVFSENRTLEAWLQTPGLPGRAQLLEEILDSMFHKTGFLTVVGIKPVSEFTANSEHFKSTRTDQSYSLIEDQALEEMHAHAFNLLREAQKSGKLKNPEIVFWINPNSAGALHVFNLKRIQSLIRDPEVISIWKQNHISAPATTDAAMALFKKAVHSRGYLISGPKWATVVVGTFLGYPPKEVEIFAREAKNKNSTLIGRDPFYRDLADGFTFDGFAVYTRSRSTLARIAWMKKSAQRALQNFQVMQEKGFTLIRILNRPDLLQQGLPPSPY